MALHHNGLRIPTLPEKWDPSDVDWVWMSWADVLRGASLLTSNWVVPTGWTVGQTLVNQTVVDSDGTSYANANGALLSTTAGPGLFSISNIVTLSDGRSIERSFTVVVENQ